MPKLRFDIQLKHRLNQTAQVMAENFAECFVDLRGFGFTSQAVTEFGLNHAEGGFNITALVVLLKKPRLIVRVVVVHPTPKRVCAPLCWVTVRFEWNVGLGVIVDHGLKVAD